MTLTLYVAISPSSFTSILIVFGSVDDDERSGSPRAENIERVIAHLEDLRERAEDFAESSTAQSTRRAYDADCRHFREWCSGHGVMTLPALPATVALYLADLAKTYKVATISRRIAAVGQDHRKAGLASPFTHREWSRSWKAFVARWAWRKTAKTRF